MFYNFLIKKVCFMMAILSKIVSKKKEHLGNSLSIFQQLIIGARGRPYFSFRHASRRYFCFFAGQGSWIKNNLILRNKISVSHEHIRLHRNHSCKTNLKTWYFCTFFQQRVYFLNKFSLSKLMLNISFAFFKKITQPYQKLF